MKPLGLRMQYLPALDGVRAVAISLVLIGHFDVSGYLGAGGLLGVDLFFVLSGYLITSVLLVEWSVTGGISLRGFYLRRILRIWPAFATLLLVYLLSTQFFSDHRSVHLRAATWAALSIMNWAQALGWGPEGDVGHAWSLSIEEQFYLAWPALLILTLSRKGRDAITPALVVLLVAGIIWRIYLASIGANPNRIYSGTDTHADSLLAGCILATVVMPTDSRWNRILQSPIAWVALFGLLPILHPVWSSWNLAWEFSATALFATWAVAGAIGKPYAILASEPAIWLGKRSYGLYLWHVPVLKILAVSGVSLWSRALIGVPLSLLFAAASYRLIEQPFLRLKSKRPLLKSMAEANPDHGQFADYSCEKQSPGNRGENDAF